MKQLAVVLTLAIFAPCAASQSRTVERPKILGIDHVSFFTTAPEGVKRLYGGLLGLTSAAPIEPGGLQRYVIGRQWVGYSSAPDPKANDRMDHVAFNTNDIVVLRQYLIAKGMKVPEMQERPDHSRSFMMADPEGHHIEFVERGKADTPATSSSAVSRHMIHAGFLVRSREAEDRFYRDILGFHPLLARVNEAGRDGLGRYASPRRYRLAGIHAESARKDGLCGGQMMDSLRPHFVMIRGAYIQADRKRNQRNSPSNRRKRPSNSKGSPDSTALSNTFITFGRSSG